MFEYLLYMSNNCIYFSYKYRREYVWWKYNTRTEGYHEKRDRIAKIIVTTLFAE